jgi:hypothetical protein
MADPRAFISFDADHDMNEKNLFAGQAKNSRTPFNLQDGSSKEPLPQNVWEKRIEEKIASCDLMIVLVGRSMSSASGVAKEIIFARRNNVPFFGVYVDSANMYSNLPAGLERNRVIGWDWGSIASAIDQMMTEGKNRVSRYP